MSISNRNTLIKGINTPLSFFVLALLIIESFLALIILKCDLPKDSKLNLIYFGGVLFLIQTTFVFILIILNRVKELTYDKEAHLAQYKSEQKIIGGTK